ncbi:MAG TPA: EmrA/EmrK family multidrug efflux transporter periplasmic adaptor subunit [Burkholderiales bacterium]|nr:EmrA/EmrK family multidrug efflux transporter periplasmic adaptor subunit [Burkholderiales bacterium]
MATPASNTAENNGNGRRRKRLLIGLTVVVLLAGLAYGLYWYFVARHYEDTDDAYVAGNLVEITPQISGTVVEIHADNTDFVRAGELLVKLDPSDARVALERAEAQLGQAVREVRGLYANNASLEAAVALREADVVKAESEVDRARQDLARRQSLAHSGAVSTEELNHARTALASAQSALAAARAAVAAAREQLAANRALTDNTSVADHPNVQRAAAQVREAYLALTRTELPAPVSGFVARRSVQVGSRVQPGTPLMDVVPLDQVWVEANFKESQLRGMRIGQPVTLTADMYGGKVTYHGTVDGLGAGTGSAFSLLPPQNATGNWIKIVQRLPVRIALDPKQLDAHPLRVGLSMNVRVDISKQSGQTLSEATRKGPVASTAVFNNDSKGADEIVSRIIAQNLGGSGAPNAPSSAAAPAAPRAGEPKPAAVAARPAGRV